MLDLLALGAFSILLLVAATSDVATMTIPNWVCAALAAAFPIAALASGVPLATIGFHLLWGFAILAVGFLLFQINVFGGGDAKLIAAAAVWTGFAAFGPFLLWTALAGGVLALVLLIARHFVKPAEQRPAFVNRLLKIRGGVPYGVAIMTGGLMVLHALPFEASALTPP
ncbi:MAG: prepilin peptidase [Hyphomonadaceae bacterium]|nr:prepilin peptidase [Hyphomonadaceae bacterium]